MKCRPIIIIRATQKKMMSQPVTSTSVGIIALHFRRLVGPAQRRERPQRRGEPGVEHVLVAGDEVRALVAVERHLPPLLRRDDFLLDVIAERVADRFLLGLGDEHLAVRSVPGRNLVAPPELARDAPGLDVLHPLEIGLFPVLRHEDGRARAHRRDRRLRQGLGVDVPLVGQIGLDDRRRSGRHAAPCACSARSAPGSRNPPAAPGSACARRSGRCRRNSSAS